MFFIFFCRKSALKIGAKFHNCTRASLIRSGFKTKGASTFYRIFFNLRKFTAVVRNEPLGWDHHHSIQFFFLFKICLPRLAPLSQSSAALKIKKEIFANLSRLRMKEFYWLFFSPGRSLRLTNHYILYYYYCILTFSVKEKLSK